MRVQERGQFFRVGGWWVLFLVCLVYGGFALWIGGLEVLSHLGPAVDSPLRELPGVFAVHAIAGGLVLLSGPIQFREEWRRSGRNLHRALGRIYGASVLVASGSAAVLAIEFDVDATARAAFLTLAILWFGSTASAARNAQLGRITMHREGMTRSFSLSLFFVTFSLWVPALQHTPLPDEIAYSLGVFLAWALNLLAAELWIRRVRSHEALPLPRLGLPLHSESPSAVGVRSP
jgi:uncharacterized membrane protein